MTEREIFLAALEQPNAEARAAFLVQACGTNAGLRDHIAALLAEHEKLGSYLEAPVAAGRETVGASPTMSAGAVIGPYKLLEAIGEGGMGAVWMAQQTEPVKRVVALKLIKAGMDSKQVIARFEAERQALALMDHANIAKVLDAGTTENGRPYFVMDLVKGVPITKYCDDHRLTPRQRLELFIPVCQAIQHAHQKGIIHRDLKPSNVLVAHYDGKPVPKVIDFGVAKAAGPQLTDKTLVTGFGNIVGTLEYMSPEQAEVNQLDIDTRSDIYSLGVLLYELLAGSPPFTRKDLEKAGMLEMLRVIREQEPSKPSTKLSSSDALPTLSANRGTEPAKLTKLVRGELDWIVMKSLEKDRNRRYETANGFAMDVQRYLTDEAVHACPPSAWYRFKKFVRRNKGPVVAAAAVLLTLLCGIAGTTVGLVRAEWAWEEEAKRADAESRAKREAEEREAETRAMLDFVEHGIFVARMVEPNPLAGSDDKATLRRAVDEALPFVERFKDRPLIEARLRLALGAAFNQLTENPLAAQQFERARALYEEHRGPNHPDTLVANLTLAHHYRGSERVPEALRLLNGVWEHQRDILGADHPDTLATRITLADCYYANNQPAEGLKLRKEILSLLAARRAPLEPGFVLTLEAISASHFNQEQKEEGLKLLKQVLEIQKTKLSQDDPSTLSILRNLSVSYALIGQHAEVVKVLEDMLKIQKAKPGPVDYATIETMEHLAHRYDDLGRPKESLPLRVDLLAARRKTFPPDHPEIIRSMNRLAQTYAALDRHKDALKLREEVLKIWIAQFEADPPRWLRDRHEVLPRDFVEMVELLKTAADSHAGLGRHADAAVQYARVMELYKALFARYREEAPNYRAEVALTVAKLGEAQLLGTGKIEEAEARLAEARKLADHPAVLDRIGSAYARAGQWNKAAAAYGHRAELSPGHEHWYRAASLYLAAGDHEAYRRACREMIERYCQEGETLHPQIAGRTAVACSLASNAVPDFRVVERLAERAVTATEKFPDHHDFAWARGLAEYRAGRHAGAIEWLKRSKPSDIGSGRDATVFAALAMANHRIGEAKQAKASLAKAKAIVAERMPDPARGRPFAPGDWHDWLHAQILIREAEGVVKEKAGDKKSTLTEPD